mmetsp:Transcript_49858/g.82745  ORF Transcript_49858/g.82745 Transcript_49858/m.82745 type:complete len:124 (-) Transcript_49858:60-431(-)
MRTCVGVHAWVCCLCVRVHVPVRVRVRMPVRVRGRAYGVSVNRLRVSDGWLHVRGCVGVGMGVDVSACPRIPKLTKHAYVCGRACVGMLLVRACARARARACAHACARAWACVWCERQQAACE